MTGDEALLWLNDRLGKHVHVGIELEREHEAEADGDRPRRALGGPALPGALVDAEEAPRPGTPGLACLGQRGRGL